jgi:DNA-binding PadR family transcriptional regulator
MALEHALLVSLSEQPASGLELARRFERSIGFFWHATHQQIYRVLARMDAAGWLTARTVPQAGRPDKRVYAVSATGRAALAEWLAIPTSPEPLRSELAVKLRGASYGERSAVLDLVRVHLAEHRTRLVHYQHLVERDYPEPADLGGHDLDAYLVLRGGILLEQFWLDWLGEYLAAQEAAPRTGPSPSSLTTPSREMASR